MNRQNWYLALNIFYHFYDLSTKSMTVVDTPNCRVGNALFFTEVVHLILYSVYSLVLLKLCFLLVYACFS